MNARLIHALSAATLSIVLALLLIPPTQAQEEPSELTTRTYLVTVTNLTRSQILSPPIVFSHDRSIALFEPGEPVIPELAILAEDGSPAELAAVLDPMPEVLDVVTAGGPVMPGTSTTLSLELAFPYTKISAAAMLITSNDAFFAVLGAERPEARRAGIHYAPAYDSGSEGNNELCDFIPGPPCAGGGVRNTAEAEGFAYVHNGIHGIGDIPSDLWDWHNPVVKVVIRRAN